MAQMSNLPPALIAKYRKRFDAFDLNKDGIVTLREMATVAKVLGYKLTKEEIMAIFGRTDFDKSGGITFEEFVQKMQERVSKGEHKKATVREKFVEYDTSGTGFVTAEDAVKILEKELGFDESKTETLLDRYDKNKDYQLSIEEFVGFYSRVEDLKTELQKTFTEWDKDGSGYIELEEAKAMLTPRGYTEDEVETLVRVHDTNGDGRLCYVEFAKYWNIPIF